MKKIVGEFTLDQAKDLANFLQIDEVEEVKIYEGDILEDNEDYGTRDTVDYDYIIDRHLKFLKSLITEPTPMKVNVEESNNQENRLLIEEIENPDEVDDIANSYLFEKVNELLNPSPKDRSQEEETKDEAIELEKRYNLYSVLKIENEIFDKLVANLDYIRRAFAEEIYDAVRIVPSKEVTSQEIGDSIFISHYNNGVEEFTLYSVNLDKKVIKEENKGRVLGKSKK